MRSTTRTFQNPVGRSLAKRRRMTGLTQHDLARLTGIPVSRIAFAETGRLDLEPQEVDKIRTSLRKRAKTVMDSL